MKIGSALVCAMGLLILGGCEREGDDPRPLSEQPSMQRLGGEKGWVRTRTVWRNDTIPVCWENLTTTTAAERAWVQDAVERSWDGESAVDFTGWGKCAKHSRRSRGIRIAVTDGSASTAGLGNVIDGDKAGLKLNVRYRSWNSWCRRTEALRESCLRANAVHEFGHALSFAHEHNRHDRPDTCTALRQGSDGDLILTPWDPASIMNYCNDRRMREGGRLSAGDISSVRDVYGQPPPG